MRLYCSWLVALIAALLALMLSIMTARPGANPYSDIAARNVFGLKDPPAPAPFPAPVAPKPAPDLVLTGLADFSTLKWALVTRTDPGQTPKKHTLKFGETEGGLQLIALNAQNATATLRLDGANTVTLRLVAPTNPPAKATTPAQLSAAGRVTYPRRR